MRHVIFLICGGLLLAAPAQAQSVLRGMKIAVDKCSACHSIGKAGNSPNRHAPPFRTFGDKWPLESLEEALAEGIEVGHRGAEMPEFAFDPHDIGHLLSYMRSLRK